MQDDNIELKICGKCKEPKLIELFSKYKANKDGYKSYCKVCAKQYYKPKSPEKAKRDTQKYLAKNPTKRKEIWANYYANNKEKVLKAAADKYRNGGGREKTVQWAKNNRDRINENKRRRRANMTIEQRLEKKCRDRFYKVIVRMKKGMKHCSPMKLIGCSLDELKLHIECQFLNGMTWGNHGNGDGKWNIDHEVPLHTFDLFKLEEQQKAFHYTNLRPIWSTDNFKRPENKKSFYERAKSIIN